MSQVSLSPAAAPESTADSSASPTRAHLIATLKSWPVMLSLVVLIGLVLVAICAPLLSSIDPTAINPAQRLKPITAEHWLGTDAFGRDVYTRILYGARVSLLVGLGVAAFSLVVGLFVGVLAGYFRWVDAIVMRVMDGLMAIPGILLAIALVSLSGSSLLTVLIAITVPEVPRVVRLVRGVILSVRNESYVEAAQTLGTPLPTLMMRHLVPNTIAPLIVQCTYIFASAILTEAILSFLGAGVPPETSSWGNIMAEGRSYFQLFPGLVLYPGVLLSLTVLSVNLLGDALRDSLDPRMAKRM
ncbi:peptide/nickel transport system permease protein [Acidovorax temperans]|uniref:Peptide/nickel transport system permease protein n=1 Tax=Acidovorax temperans TaxID=80878 RepID=A0A543KWI2_9BURK|nr:ABC transporter permease [Acidovorax temperans]TQM99439.1 peptide/nickel transport system permease protein [Acidovorax temperans]